jgi:hypothetical protein
METRTKASVPEVSVSYEIGTLPKRAVDGLAFGGSLACSFGFRTVSGNRKRESLPLDSLETVRT